MNEAITTWLYPLREVLDPAGSLPWPELEALAADLDEALATYPVGADLPAGAERSHRLLAIRRELAEHGHADNSKRPAVWPVLAQFIAGYRDLDLRDATGLGHGRLIAQHGTPAARRQWIPRLAAGEMTGIAVTEPHGGSRVVATHTHAVPGPGDTWRITGRKTWISRLAEAAVFVIFFCDPAGRLAAAVVDADQPGLRRQPLPPSGLAGWSWGILELDSVAVTPHDVLRGDGMALLRQHFAAYRPLVTATALGGTAAIFDTVTTTLTARHACGDLPRLRDSALITLGRTHAQITTALLGAIVASRIASTEHDQAERWAAAMKAHGIDTANHTAAELALLLGAVGFRADSPIAKTRRDLNGLLYADGIHDSLFRAAGKQHLSATARLPQPRNELQSTEIPA